MEDQNATDCDESDVEEKLYQNFIQRSIETSDSDDDDFIYNLNGEDISDTDSQSSIATEDLSDADNETEKQWSGEVSSLLYSNNNSFVSKFHVTCCIYGFRSHQAQRKVQMAMKQRIIAIIQPMQVSLSINAKKKVHYTIFCVMSLCNYFDFFFPNKLVKR